MIAMVTIEFAVPVGYQEGDYARLFGNGGSGDIDWGIPLTKQVFDLFPGRAGIYGWGHAPWGHSRWGHAHSMRTPGWGHLPWGKFPWGHGTALITATHQLYACGAYKFAFGCYDSSGNVHQGSPEEVTVYIHMAPDAPAGFTKNSYNKTTDVLVLNAA